MVTDDTLIEDLELPGRLHILRKLDGIKTVGDLRNTPDHILTRAPNLGWKTLRDICAMLGPHKQAKVPIPNNGTYEAIVALSERVERLEGTLKAIHALLAKYAA